LAYVKVLADKKKAGLPLSPAETKILDNANVAAQKVQDAAQEAVEESLSNRIKDFIFSASGIAFFSALILLVAYLAHRKAKNG
jgi:lipopolysaccharide/colanic/teichoic acid biosynthesis glycosyltransferase